MIPLLPFAALHGSATFRCAARTTPFSSPLPFRCAPWIFDQEGVKSKILRYPQDDNVKPSRPYDSPTAFRCAARTTPFSSPLLPFATLHGSATLHCVPRIFDQGKAQGQSTPFSSPLLPFTALHGPPPLVPPLKRG